jgi:hypothetical protein
MWSSFGIMVSFRIMVITLTVHLQLYAIATANSQSASNCQAVNLAGVPGVPGVPGSNGSPGKDGDTGPTGPQGPTGPKGETGLPGQKGASGKVGPTGPTGPKGSVGVKGNAGEKGQKGDLFHINWKQCVWEDVNDHKDFGLIRDCSFRKIHHQTSLEVAFAGNLAVHCSGSSACCKRYYFKFNGSECTAPATIDGLVYKSGSIVWPHRHKHVEGYCVNIPAGTVTVGFYIGDCRGGYNGGDGYTGWNTVSRIVIKEVPPPQA